MAERLTEAQLRQAARRIDRTGEPGSPLDIARRAIAEIHRLRSIIVSAVAPFPGGYEPVDDTGCCLFCGVRRSASDPHDGPCAWPRLVEEAEAVAAEDNATQDA
jgi:hypothetical protein